MDEMLAAQHGDLSPDTLYPCTVLLLDIDADTCNSRPGRAKEGRISEACFKEINKKLPEQTF